MNKIYFPISYCCCCCCWLLVVALVISFTKFSVVFQVKLWELLLQFIPTETQEKPNKKQGKIIIQKQQQNVGYFEINNKQQPQKLTNNNKNNRNKTKVRQGFPFCYKKKANKNSHTYTRTYEHTVKTKRKKFFCSLQNINKQVRNIFRGH